MICGHPKKMNNWFIQAVDLNVRNLKLMRDFYTQMIGLKVIEEKEAFVSLGVDSPLLNLYEVKDAIYKESYGLYHMAFLVPTQKDLAEILIHLIRNKALISGASDHGYSLALYLNDPENNGIEIYVDKPMEQWDIQEDGQILGVTLELDANALLAQAQHDFIKMPTGTKMGHVHLKVRNLKETQDFYEKLGLDLKSDFGGQAKFFAQGMYHHHIGTNTWFGTNLNVPQENQLGLKRVHLLSNQKQPHDGEVVDPSGIVFKINSI